MAAPRRNRTHPDDPASKRTREKIQTTQLVKRLSQYALNEKDDAGQEVKLDSTRIRAIEILLNKTLPNLTATELTNPDKSMVPTITINQAEIKPTTKD